MQKTWDWAACSFQFPDNAAHAQIIQTCRSAGFSFLEAKPSFVEAKTESELEKIRGQYEKANLRLDSFHLPFGSDDDVAAFYETARKKAQERMLYYFAKSASLGSRVVIMHPTTSNCPVTEEGMDRFLFSLDKTLKVLLRCAEKLGLIIALENMPPGRFGSAPEHFELFAAKFSNANLGFCLDTGHAQMYGGQTGPRDFFDAMSDRLVAFHLQDNAGDKDSHLAPGYGRVDWKVVFSNMLSMNFTKSACIEAPPFDYGPYKTHSVEAWKNLVYETDDLVENSTREQI